MRIEVNVGLICAYCKKPIKRKRKTCGNPMCQYKHHIKHIREYWNKYHRKTDQVRKSRLKI